MDFKRTLRSSLLLTAIGILAESSWADPEGVTAAKEAEISEAILAIAEAYNSAWGEWTAEAILPFHGEGFEYYWYDMRLAEEFETVLREVWLPESTEYSIEMLDPQLRVLGRDAAILSFGFRDREVNTSGQIQHNTGALAYVFERSGPEWKIVRIHQSGPVPEEYSGADEGDQ